MNKILILIILSLSCAASGEELPDAPPLEPTWVEEKTVEEWFWMPAAGIKYDSVTGITGAGGIRYGKGTADYYFLILQAEAGEGGGKLQFGCGVSHDAAFIIKSSLLRTWGDPIKIEPDQTYFGIELQYAWIIGGAVGLYTELDGDGEDQTLFTWSAGILF